MMKKNTFIEAEDRSTLKLLQILLQPTSATHQRIFGSAPDRAVLNEKSMFHLLTRTPQVNNDL